MVSLKKASQENLSTLKVRIMKDHGYIPSV